MSNLLQFSLFICVTTHQMIQFSLLNFCITDCSYIMYSIYFCMYEEYQQHLCKEVIVVFTYASETGEMIT